MTQAKETTPKGIFSPSEIQVREGNHLYGFFAMGITPELRNEKSHH